MRILKLSARFIAVLTGMSLTACNELKMDMSNGSDSNSGSLSSSSTPAPTVAPSVAPVDKSLSSTSPHFSDLALYFKPNGAAGSILADQSLVNTPVGGNATMNGATTFVSAPANSGIDFTGNTSGTPLVVAMDGDFSYNSTSSFTVTAWVKFTSTTTWTRIASNGKGGWENGWALQTTPDAGCGDAISGSLGAGMGAGNTYDISDSAYVRTTQGYGDGNWHFIAMVVDQNVGYRHLTYYVDGAKASIETIPIYDSGCSAIVNHSCGTVTANVLDFTACTNAGAGTSWGNSWIGAGRGGGWDMFKGSIGEMAVYSAALSTADLAAIYARQH